MEPAAQQSAQILAAIKADAPFVKIVALDDLIPNGILSFSSEVSVVVRHL